MRRTQTLSETDSRCQKCGSVVSFVDETCTHVEIDGEFVKTFPGDLSNRNCVRCTYPDLYREWSDHDEEQLNGSGVPHCFGRLSDKRVVIVTQGGTEVSK